MWPYPESIYVVSLYVCMSVCCHQMPQVANSHKEGSNKKCKKLNYMWPCTESIYNVSLYICLFVCYHQIPIFVNFYKEFSNQVMYKNERLSDYRLNLKIILVVMYVCLLSLDTNCYKLIKECSNQRMYNIKIICNDVLKIKMSLYVCPSVCLPVSQDAQHVQII